MTADWVTSQVGWVDAESLPDSGRAKQVERELDGAEAAYAQAQAH